MSRKVSKSTQRAVERFALRSHIAGATLFKHYGFSRRDFKPSAPIGRNDYRPVNPVEIPEL